MERDRIDRLERYRSKRDFARTPEPAGDVAASGGAPVYVIQKHAATRLHYDFRLELDGTMRSWAVPKGPSLDPSVKRMAIQVEDHPMSYNTFEGTIPPKQYGAGTVIVWDRGHWLPQGDPHAALAAGKLVFALEGEKLHGLWELVRIAKPGERQDTWLLFKKRDGEARPSAEYDIVSALPDSVITGPARTRLPARLAPQLATPSAGVTAVEGWQVELKFDGYRVMTRVEDGVARLITRNGHDWTAALPAQAAELARIGGAGSWLDGELVALDDRGVPSFHALQRAFAGASTDGLVYVVFDLPFHDGVDLRARPLRERRVVLEALLAANPGETLRFSQDFDADVGTLLASARELGFEGVIAKRADAPYVSGRTDTWLKVKDGLRQEFVVGGFTDRGGDAASKEIGSLLLGVHDDAGGLVFVGGVGTGWDAATAASLKATLSRSLADRMPFDTGPPVGGRWARRSGAPRRWVRPRLVVEARFAGWTPDGQLRHAVFVGLRPDKPVREVVREVVGEAVREVGRELAVRPPGSLSMNPSRPMRRVTHPERVIDPSTGLTKLDLVRYYESVADRLLVHLKGRPCSMVRAPDGVAGKQFFQKHVPPGQIEGIRQLDAALWADHDPLLEVPSVEAIVAAAQMNVVEFHTWNATVRHIDAPDRIVFDLDPGEGVAWPRVQEAATLMRSFLEDLGLRSWLKTSGGKGLHLVVPIARRHDAETVKAFTRSVVRHVARVVPDRFVATSGPSNRVGRIFVDYLRNGHGATTVAAFSARGRPGLGVSMPIDWDALDEVESGAHWTIATAREYLAFQREDPWREVAGTRQSLATAMKRLPAER